MSADLVVQLSLLFWEVSNMSNSVRNWRRQKKTKPLRNRFGTIVSWTEIVTAPPQFQKQAPYVVVLVELDGGGSMYGQLVDCDAATVKKGQRVRSIIRVQSPGDQTEDVIAYGLKFAPVTTE